MANWKDPVILISTFNKQNSYNRVPKKFLITNLQIIPKYSSFLLKEVLTLHSEILSNYHKRYFLCIFSLDFKSKSKQKSQNNTGFLEDLLKVKNKR
jgi:hypothetical protein